jgi:dTDP-4-amino-4,6-dideoxygalactose transaminase
MTDSKIDFNRTFLTGNEATYIGEALASRSLTGDGRYTQLASAALAKITGSTKPLLTHSCTASLEMAALLIDAKPGDEIIMPSYTFVSTANAFVLRGATPVFVDIDADTLNVDPAAVAKAITSKTKAIVPVHYAGMSANMDSIGAIAKENGLWLIEDAAQGMFSSYRGRHLGTIGDLGCVSFHGTKNIATGEGGALLINNETLRERAEIIREKGTNRSQFLRGDVDKYTWHDIGSSYLPSDIMAATLLAQLEDGLEITSRRSAIWNRYHEAFAKLEADGFVKRPRLDDGATVNGHIYYLICRDKSERDALISDLRGQGISLTSHYVPLHSSPAGERYGRADGPLPVTDRIADSIARLPIYPEMEDQLGRVVAAVEKFYA